MQVRSTIKSFRPSGILLFLILCTFPLHSQINIYTHYQRGRQQLANLEFTEAIQTFNTILSYNPDHAEALFYRGLAKYQLSDYSGAEKDFNRSIEIKPYKTEALYYRALIKIQKSKYLDAFRDVQQAIEMDNRHPEYFLTRGWLHIEYGDTSGAISDYKKAIDLDPDLDNAHLNLSIIYMNQEKYKIALSHCDSADLINPNNPASRITRGNILQLQGKYADAIEQYKLVLKKDSMNVRAWFFTAICYQEVDSYDAALEAYGRTIALNSNNAVVYYNRGILYLNMENYRKARADFDKVVTLSPKNIYAYYIRGVIKTRLDDFKGAEEDFSLAIDLYPGLIHAYRDRSVTRLALNDLKGYTEDKNTVDSLLNIKVPGFDLSEISYLKTITEFNSDFTPTERVSSFKIQYSKEEVQMISIYTIVLRVDQYDQSYQRVRDILLPLQSKEPFLVLELKNQDYNLPDESVSKRIETFAGSLENEKMDPNGILLRSLLLGWEMKYREAIKVIDESGIDLSGNYLASFIRGNHNFAIAEIISSIESQEIYPADENTTILEYYRNAINDYSQAINLNPRFIYALFNRAYVESLSKELEVSLLDYSRCIDYDPGMGAAYYNRGLLQIFMDFPLQGCQDLSRAGELGINSSYKVIYKYCRE